MALDLIPEHALTLPGHLTPTSYELPEDLPFERWQHIGHALQDLAGAHMWWLGDWWRFGERAYGDMASQETRDAVKDTTGWAYDTLEHAQNVARRFENCRRRQNLSWAHHQEVAPLPPEVADAWLDRAEAEGWSRNQLRTELRQSKVQEARAEVMAQRNLPTGTAVVRAMDGIALLREMREASADLLLTDPPYSTDIADIAGFAAEWVPLALSRIKATGRAYICTGAYPAELAAYLDVLQQQPYLHLAQVLLWTYRNTLGPAPALDYKLNWQAIFYLRGEHAPPLDCPLLNEQFSVQDIAAPDGRQGTRDDPWQKPDELGERLVRHATAPGALVVDPFAGTGTFVAAAALLGRRALGAEIDAQKLALCAARGLEVVHGER